MGSVNRADFAKIQNEVLEKNGDAFLARLFNRIPEEYIGVISSKDDAAPKIEQLKKFRSLRCQHFDLLLQLDSLTKQTEELETKDAAQISCLKAKKLIDSKEF